MAGYRLPGSLCVQALPWSIFDGTLVLARTPLPGPVCGNSSRFPARATAPAPAGPGVQRLFRQCLNPAMGLQDADYAAAATALGVDVAAIKAVAEVEAPGSAFDAMGRPRILFERHYFHRLTAGRYDKKHGRISARRSGGYGKFSVQCAKLEEAYGLAPDAALRSASWGRFQIMGNNHRAAGFSTVDAFVEAMMRSEAAQLKAFVSFVASDKKMLSALRQKDWAAFAKAYNGAGYRKNLYDEKLQAAYQRFSQLQAPRPANSPKPAAGVTILPMSLP